LQKARPSLLLELQASGRFGMKSIRPISYPIYYLQKGAGSRPQLWKVEESRTWGLTPLHTAKPIATRPDFQIWDVNAQSGWKKEDFIEPKLLPGRFHPRMARPSAFYEPFGCPVSEEDQKYIAEAVGQLSVFCRDLDAICRTVQPVTANYNTYGHDIRNLLILACTEVEAHWKGVLRLNGRNGQTTKDYVDLHATLKLDSYRVRIIPYSWLGEFVPFDGWGNKQASTSSLPWYSAYNSAKHDRENEFSRATLEQVFNAVSACAVMLVAQFGWSGLRYIDQNQPGMLSYFSFSSQPEWELSDYYVDYFDGETQGYCPEHFKW
jgi:hypothetical protein